MISAGLDWSLLVSTSPCQSLLVLTGLYTLLWGAAMVTRYTYSCSPAAWHCRNNPACSSGRRHPRCDKGSADIRRFGCHRTPGPTCRCCYCTDRADMSHPLPRGFHSNQVRTHHIEHLQRGDGSTDIRWDIEGFTEFLLKHLLRDCHSWEILTAKILTLLTFWLLLLSSCCQLNTNYCFNNDCCFYWCFHCFIYLHLYLSLYFSSF